MNKVLILANSSGGLYNFRFELIERLLRDGYEVHFAVPNSKKNEKVIKMMEEGAKYIQTDIDRRGSNPIRDFELMINYKNVIGKVNPDVILTYTVKPNIYGTYVASFIYNKPVIMNITGIGTSLVKGRLKKIVKKLYKYACKRTEYIFFQNEGNYNFFKYNDMIDEQANVRIIPGSGVNIKKFRPLKKESEDDTIKFLFIARIMKEKGIEEYLEVAQKLTKKYSDIEFQILGGFEEEKYKEQIVNNSTERIIFLGRSSDVRKEIREVDCIVHPSYHEGMSNVLLEGGAMGKPLIASNIHGCKEIIEDGYNGYLFKVKSVNALENKIINFLKLDKAERKTMGENSRKKIELEFDRNIVIDEYIHAIEDILNKG